MSEEDKFKSFLRSSVPSFNLSSSSTGSSENQDPYRPRVKPRHGASRLKPNQRSLRRTVTNNEGNEEGVSMSTVLTTHINAAASQVTGPKPFVNAETHRFHPGSNISSCGTFASFGSAYSAEPIAPIQQVVFRIVELTEQTGDSLFRMPYIDIGFTKRNPLTKDNDEAKALTKSLTHEDTPLFKDDVISFYFSYDRKVHYAVNAQYRGTFAESIDALIPVWAILIIFGEVKSVQLVEAPPIFLPQTVQKTASNLDGPLLGIQSLAIDRGETQSGPVPSTSKFLNVHDANDTRMTSATHASNMSQAEVTVDDTLSQDCVAPLGFSTESDSAVAFRFYPDVNVSRDGTIADLSDRQTSSLDPISSGQQIAIRIVDFLRHSDHEMRDQRGKVPLIEIGFTKHDPALQHITRFLKFDISSVWKITLCNDNPCSKGDVLSYYFNRNEVHFALNGQHKGTFRHSLDVQNRIWATFFMSGEVKTIEIVGTEEITPNQANLESAVVATTNGQKVNTKKTPTVRKNSHIKDLTNSDFDSSRLSFSDLDSEESSGLVSERSDSTSTVELSGLKYVISYPGCQPDIQTHRPLELYKENGKNSLNIDEGVVVYRKGADSACVFTKTPMTPGTTIVLEILNLQEKQTIGVGFTSCDPKTLNKLPNSVESLVNRPDYWMKSPLSSELYDEIAIVLSENGEVMVRRNASKPYLLMAVDISVPLWAFIDVYGRVRLNASENMRSLNEPQASNSSHNVQTAITRPGMEHSTTQRLNIKLRDEISVLTDECAPTNTKAQCPFNEYIKRNGQRYRTRNQRYRPLELHSKKGPSAFVQEGTFTTKPGVFTKSYVFSRHPIRPGQAVVLKSLTTWDIARWSKVGFGFTTSDPAEWHNKNLNKPMPVLFEREVYSEYLKSLKPQDELAFILEENGIVWLSLNGRNVGYQLMETAVTVPLWAVFVDIDVHNARFWIAELDPVLDKCNLQDFSTESYIREIDTKFPLRYQNKAYYRPLELYTKEHSSVCVVEGAGIAIETDMSTTDESWWRRSHVFSCQPLLPGQTLVIQMLTSRRMSSARNVGVGFTICDPVEFFEDVDEPMSFYYEKGILNYIYMSKSCVLDELAITLTVDGCVTFRKNDGIPTWLMDTPITLPLWAVVDMGTEMREIRLWIQSVLPHRTGAPAKRVTADVEHDVHITLLRECALKHQTQRFKVLKLQKKKSPSVIILEKTGVVIQNMKTDGRSLVFSQNPVLPGQTLLIQALSVTKKPGGSRDVGFGFTTCDPAKFNDTDWDKNMLLLFEGGIYSYKNIEGVSLREELGLTLSQEGEVTLRRNADTPTWFMDTVITPPLWAFVVMNLGTKEVRLGITAPPSDSPWTNLKLLELADSDDDSFDDLPNKTYIRRLNKIFPLKSRDKNYQPLELHSKKRQSTVTIEGTGVAIQTIKWNTKSLVFSREPIQPGQTLVIQVLSLETSPGLPKKVSFGFTTCDPAKFNNEDLIYKPLSELFQRGLYVADSPRCLRPGDEESVTCSNGGEITLQINNFGPKLLIKKQIDMTQFWWAFVDIGSGMKEIRLWISELAPNVAKAPVEVKEPDCVICLETSANCALYSCGHVCMCYDCAVQQWHRDGGGFCPLCRANIKDVIRIYK